MSNRDIIFKKVNNIGWITFNRPKKLNAISHTMIDDLYDMLLKWEADDEVLFLVIEGSGDRAFSAGGDVRELYDLREDEIITEFVIDSFSKEYTMDMKLHNYPKPIVTHMDGITMGGGVGIGVTGSHRIVTEKTKWAMPEVDIGLFPDVGASYFLNKAPEHIGKYLALTGKVIGGEDVVYSNLADYYIESLKWPQIKVELLSEKWEDKGLNNRLDKVLKGYNEYKEDSSIRSDIDKINLHFKYECVEEILDSLFNSSNWGDLWAKDHLRGLLAKSPTSLKVILKQISDGKRMDMRDCFNMELVLVLNFIKSYDFFEGVRAVLVDKDRSPSWNPKTVHHVGKDVVDGYFSFDWEDRVNPLSA